MRLGDLDALKEIFLQDRCGDIFLPKHEETYTDLSGTIETYTRFKCDRCMQGQNFGPYHFCPWCGADMKPKEEEQP